LKTLTKKTDWKYKSWSEYATVESTEFKEKKRWERSGKKENEPSQPLHAELVKTYTSSFNFTQQEWYLLGELKSKRDGLFHSKSTPYDEALEKLQTLPKSLQKYKKVIEKAMSAVNSRGY